MRQLKYLKYLFSVLIFIELINQDAVTALLLLDDALA